MVVTPDINGITCVDKKGVKYFELVAEPIKRELIPGVFINAWGYNGSTPGPVIQVYPGDYVNIRLYNKLPEPTNINWHGMDVSNKVNGRHIEIEPGGYFDYQFKIVNSPGTHMYHANYNISVQRMMGLQGGFIILDPNQYGSNIQSDYFIMLQQFMLKELNRGEEAGGIYDLDPFAGEFNFFTMNGKCYPATTTLNVQHGEVVRIRFANDMADAHPIHIDGHQFSITASDGNPIPRSDASQKNTIVVASGETWDIQFAANNPGIWNVCCSIPHHMSNNYGKCPGGMISSIAYD